MDIIFDQIKSTGIIKLNRPSALNALNFEMSQKFYDKLIEWEKNQNIKQVLLIGEGKNFCAGGDVKSLVLEGKNSLLKKKFFLSEYKLNYKINNFSKPYLSIWNGVVMGGGVGLSIYGKYRIVTDTTKFAMPETSIGFFPDVGGSYFLSRIKNNYGMFLALTGKVIYSDEIINLDLGTDYCPSDQIDNLIDIYITTGKIKKFKMKKFNNSNTLKNIRLINNLFNGNIKKIFDKIKKDKEIMSKELLDLLKKKCPMSLAVTSELINRGKKMNLGECLKMEYKLSQNMVYRDDFDKGIDAVLISKHHKPKWSPKSIYEINLNNIDKLFIHNTESLKLS